MPSLLDKESGRDLGSKPARHEESSRVDSPFVCRGAGVLESEAEPTITYWLNGRERCTLPGALQLLRDGEALHTLAEFYAVRLSRTVARVRRFVARGT